MKQMEIIIQFENAILRYGKIILKEMKDADNNYHGIDQMIFLEKQ